MDQLLRQQMIMHAGIIAIIGFVAGLPLALTSIGLMEGSPSFWRLAHMEGILNSLFIFAVAAVSKDLNLHEAGQKTTACFFILMGYSNALFGWVSAIWQVRGLTFEGPFANIVAAILGTSGVVFAFPAILLVIYGAYRRFDVTP